MRGEKLNTAEKALVVVSAILFSLAAGYGIWDYWSNLPPVVSILPERLPNPNGYDYYVKAATEMVDVGEFEWAMSPPPPKSALAPPVAPGPPSPQPAPAPGMPPPPMPGQNYVPDPVRPGATPADRAGLLKKNENVLVIARAGLQYDYCRPRPYDFGSPPIVWICDLFSLEAAVRCDRKDWSAAMDSCVDRIELGYDVRSDGCLTPPMAGRREWKLLPHLDQPACRRATMRMQKILATAATYADGERHKKIDLQRMIMEEFEKPNWRSRMASSLDVLHGQHYIREKIYYKTASKRRVMTDWTASMDEAIRIAEMPYPRMPQDLSCVSKQCAPHYHRNLLERTRWETSSATNRLFTIALALRAYKLERGAYPASLSSLAPEYLPKIPTDPFSLKPGFIYKLKGDGYLLYSLGPNCKDDGGKPHWIDSKSDDIVAGAVQPQEPKVFHVPAPAPAPGPGMPPTMPPTP